MFSSWWGSPDEGSKPLVYPECPSPTTKEEYIAVSEIKLNELKDLVSDKGWNPVPFSEGDENPNSDIRLYDKESPDQPLNCVKVSGLLPASPKEILDLCRTTDVTVINSWDQDLLSISCAEEITENIMLIYSTYRAVYPVWNREFVAVRSWREEEDGTCYSWGTSINHPRFPEPKEYVRGVILVSGWIIQPVPGEPNKSFCTRLVRLDTKGYIPAWILNLFKNKSGLTLVAIRNYVTSQKKRQKEEEEKKRERAKEITSRGRETSQRTTTTRTVKQVTYSFVCKLVKIKQRY